MHIPLGRKYKIISLPPTPASLQFPPRLHFIFTSFAVPLQSLSYLQDLCFLTDPFIHKVRFPFSPSQIPSQFLLEKRNRLTVQQSFFPSCPEQHPCTQGHSGVLEADEQYPHGLGSFISLGGKGAGRWESHRQHKENCKHWRIILGYSWSLCLFLLCPPSGAGHRHSSETALAQTVQAGELLSAPQSHEMGAGVKGTAFLGCPAAWGAGIAHSGGRWEAQETL